MSDDLAAGRPRVGFVGLGNQGGPIAARILTAGFPLTLWARRPEVLDAYPGAARAADLPALAAASQIVGVCVVDDAGVRQVAHGLLPGLRPDAVVMIHATVHPDTCVALAERLARAGVRLIDAPVSGGAEAAKAGALTVMCGGDAATIARCRPVIDSFAGRVLRLGGVGAGQKAKLVNNAVMAANLGVVHEALSIGRALGLDPAALNQVIAAGSGRSFAHEHYVRVGSPQNLHGARLLRKDVDLLASLGGRDHPASEVVFRAAEFFLAEAGAKAADG